MKRFLCCLPIVLAVFSAEFSVAACEQLVEPCFIDDVPCIQNSTKMFFEQTYKGIPSYNIVVIDPLIIPTAIVSLAGKKVKLEAKNTKIEGLRHTDLYDFKMDTKTQSVSLMTSNFDVNIESAVTVADTKMGKRTPFRLSYKGSAVLTSSYNYELKKDDKGVEHFEVGPGSVKCSQISAATPLDPELEQALSRQAGPHHHAEKDVFCEILKQGYESLLHNIRAATKVLPATAWFKNPHGEKRSS